MLKSIDGILPTGGVTVYVNFREKVRSFAGRIPELRLSFQDSITNASESMHIMLRYSEASMNIVGLAFPGTIDGMFVTPNDLASHARIIAIAGVERKVLRDSADTVVQWSRSWVPASSAKRLRTIKKPHHPSVVRGRVRCLSHSRSRCHPSGVAVQSIHRHRQCLRADGRCTCSASSGPSYSGRPRGGPQPSF